LLLLAAGCGPAGPPQFRVNLEGYDAEQVSDFQRQSIVEPLAELFGTPDAPVAPDGTGLRLELLAMAAGPIGSDEAGRSRGLYRQHCATCHGISGDGAGPTASIQDPYPRDLRHGVLKYTSTAGGAKPVAADLDRLLRRGIPGTAMPAFNKLADEEIEALIEYVKYLGIRGETELLVVAQVVQLDDYPVHRDELIDDYLLPTADLWKLAGSFVVGQEEVEPLRPALATHEERAASIHRGYALYSSKNAQCTQCHGPEGRGDGPQAGELYDDRNKRKLNEPPERFTLPIQKLRPRNFTEGIIHGGSRPIDLYWRIHVGIKGTPMPAGGPGPSSGGVLSPEEIWDVVEYVRARGQ
jgi:mono/diheme cytochrome c family protein